MLLLGLTVGANHGEPCARAQHCADCHTMKDDKPQDRASEIKAMFARIPISLLEEEGLRLLRATRHVSQGRDLPMVEEPDNAIRAKIWLACVEQDAGRAAQQKPIEPPKATDERPEPGSLRVKKAGKVSERPDSEKGNGA